MRQDVLVVLTLRKGSETLDSRLQINSSWLHPARAATLPGAQHTAPRRVPPRGCPRQARSHWPEKGMQLGGERVSGGWHPVAKLHSLTGCVLPGRLLPGPNQFSQRPRRGDGSVKGEVIMVPV